MTDINLNLTDQPIDLTLYSGPPVPGATGPTGPAWEDVPGSSGATGSTGDLAMDSSNLYVCVGTNSWKKVGLSVW